MTMSLLTVRDMAKRLRMKDKTVYTWASQGKIPCLKINGVIRFDAREIEQWLQQCHMQVRVCLRPARRIHKGLSNTKEDVDILIENARRAVYSTRGETKPVASPFGKERVNGTL